MAEEEKDFARLAETIQRLEEEVKVLKLSKPDRQKRQIIKAITNRVKRVFSRENLEIFLSLTSLVISSSIVVYLMFFQ